MIIPNAVGRIDEITEAIREGDAEKAYELLEAEIGRRRDGFRILANEVKKKSAELDQCEEFAE